MLHIKQRTQTAEVATLKAWIFLGTAITVLGMIISKYGKEIADFLSPLTQ